MKRQVLRALAAVLLVLALVGSTALAEYVDVSSSGGSLYLRKGPGKEYGTNGVVRHGYKISVVDDISGEWCKIKVSNDGRVGYIKDKYIVASVPSGGPTVYVSSSGGTLKLRAGASTNTEVLGYVHHGDHVSEHSTSGEWTRVTVAETGKTGYIKTKYIRGGSGGGGGGGGGTPSGSTYQLARVTTTYSGSKVHLRSGAGSSYSSVGTLYRGNLLKVYGESGNWAHVKTSNGKSGYVYDNYVSYGVSGKTTARVNLRKGAGTSYGVIKTVSSGASITVHKISGKWAQVTAGGSKGYMSLSYVKY